MNIFELPCAKHCLESGLGDHGNFEGSILGLIVFEGHYMSSAVVNIVAFTFDEYSILEYASQTLSPKTGPKSRFPAPVLLPPWISIEAIRGFRKKHQELFAELERVVERLPPGMPAEEVIEKFQIVPPPCPNCGYRTLCHGGYYRCQSCGVIRIGGIS